MFTLFSDNTDSNVGSLNHTYIISTISNSKNSWFFLFLFMRFDSLSKCSFLLWRASATYYTWHFHRIKKKVFTSFFILQNISKSFPINNKNSIEILFYFLPFRLPELCIGCLLNFDIDLSDILEATRAWNAFSSLNFITCNHPYFDVGTLESFNCIF